MSFLSKKPADGGVAVNPAARKRRARRGAFSAGVTALAVAAVVIFNLIVAQLPDSVTQFDMTDSGIYNITDGTVQFLAGLTEDVEIHVLCPEDQVDSRIVRFLNLYQGLSDRLTVEYTDPVAHPSVLSKYSAEAGAVVVTCASTGRQESFAIDDIIGYDLMTYYYYGTKQETDFDAEGLLTSAVDGVLTDAARKVYQTTGHEEGGFSEELTERMKKAHLSVDSVNLLTDGGVPEDCDLLAILAPKRDLAEDELAMLREYLSGGGQVVYCMASSLDTLPNLESLLAEYGMDVADGAITDALRYYQNQPFLIFPVVNSGADFAQSLSDDATILLYASRGMTITDPARDTITVQSALDTSEGGLSVTADNTQTPGVYSLGAVATEDAEGGTARLTVFGSMTAAVPPITADSLRNTDLFLSAMTCGFGDLSNLSIEPVSLQEPMNTVATGGLWALLFIFVIPLAAIVYGFARWSRRRKL